MISGLFLPLLAAVPATAAVVPVGLVVVAGDVLLLRGDDIVVAVVVLSHAQGFALLNYNTY